MRATWLPAPPLTPQTRPDQFVAGMFKMREFCQVNGLRMPDVRGYGELKRPPEVCAFYRPNWKNQGPVIFLEVARCARIGTAGRTWSYPGYVVDRTPYGVVAHEMGHHVDWCLSVVQAGGWQGDFGIKVRLESKEPPISGYAPNASEWFAEMLRLYITNPDLLAVLRPRTHHLLVTWGHLRPVERRSWRQVLAQAPPRTLVAATRHVAKMSKKSSKKSLIFFLAFLV